MNSTPQTTFFANQNEFRKWLEKNHSTATELVVGYYKVNSGIPSMTWSESVDQALCFGWIDAVRRSIDEKSYSIRFTKRRPTSIWSAVNIKKVEELTKKGLMLPAGIKAFELRKEEKSKIYSFENDPVDLSSEFENKIKNNQKAWDYFYKLAPSYKRSYTHWVMSAKQENTRIKRMNEMIVECENGRNRWKY